MLAELLIEHISCSWLSAEGGRDRQVLLPAAGPAGIGDFVAGGHMFSTIALTAE